MSRLSILKIFPSYLILTLYCFEMLQGTIVLARFWFTDGKDYKIRPALIVSNEKFNRFHLYCLMVPFTTKSSIPDYEMKVQKEDLLPVDSGSIIRTDSITPIMKEDILKHIGTVPHTRLREIMDRIKDCFS